MKVKILLPVLALGSVLFLWIIAHDRCSGIHGGMTMIQVRDIAGLPNTISTNEAGGYVQWRYNDPWPWRSFTSVFFSTNGVYRVYHP
jgi:hypothetical protein